MKITIRSETEEPTMELWLDHHISMRDVTLRGKDKNGDEWNMLRIREDGIYLCDGLDVAGWPLDADGRLKLVSE